MHIEMERTWSFDQVLCLRSALLVESVKEYSFPLVLKRCRSCGCNMHFADIYLTDSGFFGDECQSAFLLIRG